MGIAESIDYFKLSFKPSFKPISVKSMFYK